VVTHTAMAPEPFGRVVVEGIVAGRPVIATRARGVPEIIDDEQTGSLVDCNSPEALRHALKELLQHPEKRQAIG